MKTVSPSFTFFWISGAIFVALSWDTSKYLVHLVQDALKNINLHKRMRLRTPCSCKKAALVYYGHIIPLSRNWEWTFIWVPKASRLILLFLCISISWAGFLCCANKSAWTVANISWYHIGAMIFPHFPCFCFYKGREYCEFWDRCETAYVKILLLRTWVTTWVRSEI